MFKKPTNICLAIFAILLLVILFTTSSEIGDFAEDFGTNVILLTGIFALVISILIANEVKKYNNSLLSRMTSVVLVNLIWFFTLILFYGLSGIGTGDKGLLPMMIIGLLMITGAISLIIDLILVIIHKKNTKRGMINHNLAIILIIILFTVFYTAIISGLAELFQSSSVCYMHLELREKSIIFNKGARDSCLTPIAVKENNPALCESDICVRRVGSKNKDLFTCDYAKDYSSCINGVMIYILDGYPRDPKPDFVMPTPEICDVLVKKVVKDECLKIFGLELENKDFCLRLELKEKRDDCMKRLALSTNNKTLCLDVDDFLNCYAMTSDIKKNGDEKQCNVLTSKPAKETCKSYVHSKPIKAMTSDVPAEPQS